MYNVMYSLCLLLSVSIIDFVQHIISVVVKACSWQQCCRARLVVASAHWEGSV